MKRFVLLLVSLLSIGVMSGIAEDSRYVYYDVSKHGVYRYQYFVFDGCGNVLYDGYESNNPPKAQQISTEILELKYLHGNADYRRYINVSTGQVSPLYADVVTASSEYIVYVSFENNSWYIVVANLFDGVVYNQYSINLGSATGHVESATWNDTESECTIVYVSSNNYSKCSITIQLLPQIEQN